MIDTISESLRTRFELMNEHSGLWSFLYDINKASVNQDDLRKACNDLHLKLKDGNRQDINGDELCDELLRIKSLLNGSEKPVEVLKFIKSNLFSGGCLSEYSHEQNKVLAPSGILWEQRVEVTHINGFKHHVKNNGSVR